MTTPYQDSRLCIPELLFSRKACLWRYKKTEITKQEPSSRKPQNCHSRESGNPGWTCTCPL